MPTVGAGLLMIAIGCGSGRARSSPSGTDLAIDGSATADAADAATTETEDAAGAQVTGTVVSLVTLRPLSGRAVFIAGRRATTDDDGHFTIPDVGPTYDVVVEDPGGIAFSVYLGVYRRDPLLPHRGVPTGSRRTAVQGDVSGGGNYPLAGDDGVVVSFFSDQAGGSWPLSAQLVPPGLGPAYGPIPLAWNGGTSISGVLTAFGTFHSSDGGVSTSFAQRQETLNDGQTTFANLALAPVAGSLHVAGRIGTPPNSTVLNTRLFYRLPIAGATINLASGRSASIDDDAPVLNYSGAELCVSATAIPGSTFAQRCDLSAGNTDASLTLQAPPAFTSPAEGDAVSKDTALAWTSFNNGISVLELEGDPPSTAMPNVDVYTTGTTAGWPDLTAAGVPFPAAAAYRCSVGGFGPFASLDEALGPAGVGAPFPPSTSRSFSPVLNVTTAP